MRGLNVNLFLTLLLLITSTHYCKGWLSSTPSSIERRHITKNIQHKSLTMRLLPLSRNKVRDLLPLGITKDQWTSYWGLDPMERLQKVLESVLISYGGAWLAWFTSFMAGSFVAACVGTALLFNWMYFPLLNARRRNLQMWPRRSKLFYALFSGRISKLERVRRRAGKTVGGASQEFLHVTITDEVGRELEIFTQWRDEYRRLRKGMNSETLVGSPTKQLQSLSAVSDSWIPASDVWVGDYPYLDKASFTDLTLSVPAIVPTPSPSSSVSSSSAPSPYQYVNTENSTKIMSRQRVGVQPSSSSSSSSSSSPSQTQTRRRPPSKDKGPRPPGPPRSPPPPSVSSATAAPLPLSDD